MRRFFSPLALLLGIGACVPTREPAPAPPARPPAPVVALPPAPPSSDWRDWPMTAGTWAYRRDGRGSIALFGHAGGEVRLTLRCDAGARRLYLSQEGSSAAPLRVRTSTLTRSLPMQPTGGAPAYVASALTAEDPLLDAMAFSRGHFIVEQPGAPTLVVPAWPEIGRVVDDCRN
jgi:hypothetical protein